MRINLLVWGFGAVLFFAACSGADDDNNSFCLEGQVLTCPCLDGTQGTQTCQITGRFAPCACGDDAGIIDGGTDVGDPPDADTDVDSDADVSTHDADATANDTDIGLDVDPDAPPEVCDPECGEDEYCLDDVCITRTVCTAPGQDCDEYTLNNGEFICIRADSRTDDMTCEPRCVDTDNGSDCVAGSFCVNINGNDGELLGAACVPSNCRGVDFAADCAAMGPQGGTCFGLNNGAFYCFEAGETAEGDECTSGTECASGLACAGVCTRFCELGGACGANPCMDIIRHDDIGLCAGCSGFGAQPDECGPDRGCRPYLPGVGDGGFCVEDGPGDVRADCDNLSSEPQCLGELACVDYFGDRGSECQPFCDTTSADPDEFCRANEDCYSNSNGVGNCLPSCVPGAATNECDSQPGAELCLPQSNDRGICFTDGDEPVGSPCNLIDGNAFGDCRGGLCQRTDSADESPDAPGICRSLCRTFSAQGGFDSGCAANEVCELFGLAFGMCTQNVAEPRIEAFAPCPEAGRYCDDDSLCFQVDNMGNNLCIPLCRLGEPEGDDCAVHADSACQADVLTSDSLGLCLPNQ